MIISIIKQLGLRLRADPDKIPFQYSANVQIKFEKDENYNDYTVVGYYIPPGENAAKLLSINDDGTFILGPDCFKQRGILSFSFNLINSQEEIHLGSIDFEVRYSFGDGDTILPEPEEVWISLVTQVAKDAIKEDVELVKQKANEALQSASLANDKASEAKEYANNANQSAGSASLSASSALTAKNDTIAASNSAIQAKQDAEQSANNAKNSANTALENANKSTEAIETVTQIKIEIENKANDFDTNYQEKLNAFNDNATEKQSTFNQNVTSANTNFDNKVTQANSDLDAKVQEANTIIDEKVKTATEQAQKAKGEANRAEQATDGKLDKNLGVENAGKSLVVGENGEVVCGESGINEDEVNKIIDKAIDEKLYTQEEVDYLLNDKMDKPYTSIEITDNATITDALEGNFKIDKIKGNTYQNVETDIVPTPSRPVPINSRKVKVNSEYVELRSLKETGNLFDLKYGQLLFGEKVGSTTNNGSGVIIENQYAGANSLAHVYLKANTNYFFRANRTKELIDGMEESGNDLNLLNIKKNGVAITQINSGKTFTLNESGYYDLSLYGTVGCKVSYTSIMLVEGISIPSTYIPPTIRDYKIINHVNKTAKIIRNIKNVRVTPELVANKFNDYTETMKRVIIYTRDRFVIDNVTKAGNDLSNMAITRYGSLQNGNVFADVSGIANMYWYLDISMLGLNGSETKDVASQKLVEFLTSNEMYVQYQLATPVEETITYVETDTSEVGYSWQDTTSPSPTIKSEVQGVEEINILKTGKNILNETLAKDYTNYINLGNGYSKFVVNVKPNTKYTVSRKDDKGAKLNNYMYVQGKQTMWMIHTNSNNVNVKQVTLTSTENGTLEVTFAGINQTKLNEVWDILGYLQIELGDTATAYEPYTGQHINIALPQPLYENDIANVESGEYEYEMQKYIVTGEEVFIQDYTQKSGYYGRYFNLRNGNGIVTDKVFCNYLPYVKSVWNLEQIGFCQNSKAQIHLRFTNETLGITDDTPVEEKRTAFANYLKQLYASDDPLYVVVKVAKTTQPISEDDLAKLKSLKTSAGVNNIFINGEVKPAIEARYPQDVVLAVNRLQNKLLTLQEEVVKNV